MWADLDPRAVDLLLLLRFLWVYGRNDLGIKSGTIEQTLQEDPSIVSNNTIRPNVDEHVMNNLWPLLAAKDHLNLERKNVMLDQILVGRGGTHGFIVYRSTTDIRAFETADTFTITGLGNVLNVVKKLSHPLHVPRSSSMDLTTRSPQLYENLQSFQKSLCPTIGSNLNRRRFATWFNAGSRNSRMLLFAVPSTKVGTKGLKIALPHAFLDTCIAYAWMVTSKGL
jgi:hypothetical protein